MTMELGHWGRALRWGEDVLMHGGTARSRWRSKQRVALQHRYHPIGEQSHVEFALLMRHAAIGEVGNDVVGAGQRAQFGDLLDAVIRRANNLYLHVELG